MGFADAYTAYLQKHAIRGQLISETPDPQLNTIIAIPAYNESGLTTCLDSLFHCDPPLAPTEVLVLINSAESSSREIIAANRRSYEEVREWIGKKSNQNSDPQENANRGQDPSKPQGKLRFHVVLVEDLPDKHFGAGLARKLVMDEAVRRFAGRAAGNQLENQLENRPAGPGSMGQKVEEKAEEARGAAPGQSAEEQAGRAARGKVNGIIVSLDADTVVRRDYLRAVEDHFSRHPHASGCSISFEHPLSRQEYAQSVHPKSQNPQTEIFPPEVFEAVTNYELHQRFYLLAVRYTGYPYAYHTVGSCFAVQVEAYCRAGGMSRRKAGEDFYFIQKLAMQGGFTECRSTRVYPSPRPSDRVPFGTGPDISRQIGNGQLDASAKHLNDRDSYGTGPDSRPSGNGQLDASAKHPNDRDSYGTDPDMEQPADGKGLDASAKHLNDRDSDGTGPDNWQLPPYLTYHPDLFEHLRIFFALIPRLYRSGSNNTVPDINPDSDRGSATEGDMGTVTDADPITVKQLGPKEAPENDPPAEPDGDPPTGTKREAPENEPAATKDGDPPVGTKNTAVLKGVPPVLERYLEESGFWEELEEIRGNTASEGAFRKRFFNKFNMFRILKYLHYAEEHGVSKMEVTTAAGVMLEMWENAHGRGKNCPDNGADNSENAKGSSTREMLLLYRKYFG